MELPNLKTINLKAIDWQQYANYLRANAKSIFILVLFALLVNDVLGAHGLIAMRKTQKDIEQVQKQIDVLNQQNQALSGQVSSLKTDPKAIERIAREEMGLAKPGEIIYKLPREVAKPADPQIPR
jgi:cell division protein FtsB